MNCRAVNWNSGRPPQPGFDVVFSSLARSNQATVAGSDFNLRSLTFPETPAGITASSNRFTVGAGGLTKMGAGTLTLTSELLYGRVLANGPLVAGTLTGAAETSRITNAISPAALTGNLWRVTVPLATNGQREGVPVGRGCASA